MEYFKALPFIFRWPEFWATVKSGWALWGKPPFPLFERLPLPPKPVFVFFTKDFLVELFSREEVREQAPRILLIYDYAFSSMSWLGLQHEKAAAWWLFCFFSGDMPHLAFTLAVNSNKIPKDLRGAIAELYPFSKLVAELTNLYANQMLPTAPPLLLEKCALEITPKFPQPFKELAPMPAKEEMRRFQEFWRKYFEGSVKDYIKEIKKERVEIKKHPIWRMVMRARFESVEAVIKHFREREVEIHRPLEECILREALKDESIENLLHIGLKRDTIVSELDKKIDKVKTRIYMRRKRWGIKWTRLDPGWREKIKKQLLESSGI